MLRLNYYILAFVLWLSFLFNIERLNLGVSSTDMLAISGPVYVGLLATAVISLVVPAWSRFPLWAMQLVALALFVGASVLDARPAWGGAHTYLSIFELVAFLGTATLAYIVGRSTADVVETARALLFADTSDRLYDFQSADTLLKLEMQTARRANRALSVAVLEVDAKDSPVVLSATAQEIQNLLVKRYSLTALARVLARTIRRTDFVLDQSKEGRLIVVAPEAQQEQSMHMLQRLSWHAHQQLGVGIRSGVASFPEHGATFEELVYQAEAQLDQLADVPFSDLDDDRVARNEPRLRVGSRAVVEAGVNETHRI